MAKGFQLIGDKELINIISKLPKFSQQRQVWRSTARSASRPIIKAIRSKIPKSKEGGYLKKSIKFKNFSPGVLGGLGGYIKARKKPDDPKFLNPSKMAVLVYNRRVRSLKKTIRNPFEEAAQQEGAAAANKMTNDIEKYLQRQIKKLAK